MSLDYNVVFENTVKLGGYAGIRTIIAYEDEADFKKYNSKPDDTTQAIAQGVSDEKAQDLAALTPEICRLTAAIHELCDNPEGKIFNVELADHHLFMACIGIQHDRQRIKERNLNPVPVGPIVQPTGDNTERDQLYQFVLDEFYLDNKKYNPFGSVGHNLGSVKFSTTLKAALLFASRKK